MARPLRISYPGALFHITARGNEKKKIFIDNSDKRYFCKVLNIMIQKFNVVLYCYVLMKNHYHLLLETIKGNISEPLHYLNSAYTGYFNSKHDRIGHLFQGRFKSILVEKEKYLLELSRYIHLNPVKANIVKLPHEYQWSSYKSYIGLSDVPQWLMVDVILNEFKSTNKDVRKNYRKFVEEKLDVFYGNPLKKTNAQMFLGSEQFVKNIKNNIVRKIFNKNELSEVSNRDKLFPEPDVNDIINIVHKSKLCKTAGKKRDISIYLIWKLCSHTQKKIGELFGITSSAVSHTIKKVEKNILHEKRLALEVENLHSKFKT